MLAAGPAANRNLVSKHANREPELRCEVAQQNATGIRLVNTLYCGSFLCLQVWRDDRGLPLLTSAPSRISQELPVDPR